MLWQTALFNKMRYPKDFMNDIFVNQRMKLALVCDMVELKRKIDIGFNLWWNNSFVYNLCHQRAAGRQRETGPFSLIKTGCQLVSRNCQVPVILFKLEQHFTAIENRHTPVFFSYPRWYLVTVFCICCLVI